MKKDQCKKVVNSGWKPRNNCDGRSMVNIAIMTSQVNLCGILQASLKIGQHIHLNCHD